MKIDITHSKWGLFEPFDGEMFSDNMSEIFNVNSEYYKDYHWYIQTKKISKNKYVLYYIPTNEHIKNNPDVMVLKYVITYNMLLNYFNNNKKIGIWDIDMSIDQLYISNFIWYYLGVGEEVGTETTINRNRSHKFRETRKLIQKYSINM